ncbi:hypothetical protein ACIBTP_03565 [Streptomyces avidinii]|uniref:hypothetical protein n=1 Tax=Streptomyces avidinii TaxID=1895 RepID=UPI00379A7E20
MQAAKDAIDQAEIYGALTPGRRRTLRSSSPPSATSPPRPGGELELAAKKLGQPFSVQQYAPHPLAKKDRFGLVVSLMLVPLLVGGYMAPTMLRTVTGSATGRRRLIALLGFSLVVGLAVNLVVGPWLQGYPLEKFWIVWPVLALLVAVVLQFVPATPQRLHPAPQHDLLRRPGHHTGPRRPPGPPGRPSSRPRPPRPVPHPRDPRDPRDRGRRWVQVA